MPKRPTIPRGLEKRLYQEVRSKCPVCGEAQVSVLTIHHIIPFERVQQHDLEAMIVLCANCHARADRGEISSDELFEIKRRLPASVRKNVIAGSAGGQTARITGAIAAGRDVNIDGNVVIKYGRSRRPVNRASVPGTVAQDKCKVGYLKYLGHRFNQFKEWETRIHNRKMNYALIWVQYRRELKFKIEQTPLELFPRGVAFLTRRIDKTMLWRIRRSRADKNYRELSEFESLGEDRIDLLPEFPSRVSPNLPS